MSEIRTPLDIPGYLEAIDKEMVVRSASFQPVNEKIGEFEAAPLTLRKFSLLRLINSPFIPPFDTPSTAELAAFLWIVSPVFSPGESKTKKRFMRRCRMFVAPRPPIFSTRRVLERWKWNRRKILTIEAKAVQAAREFVEESLQDRPARTVSSGIEGPSYYCDEVGVCSALAREYGWAEADILDMPLKRTFGYLKEIMDHHAPPGQSALLCNPSDELKDKALAEMNRRNN